MKKKFQSLNLFLTFLFFQINIGCGVDQGNTNTRGEEGGAIVENIQYNPTYIVDELAEGRLSRDEAYVALWAAFLGHPEYIPPSILENITIPSTEERVENPPHFLMAKAIHEIDQLSPEAQSQLRSLLGITTFNATSSLKKSSLQTPKTATLPGNDWCEWPDTNPYIRLLVQQEEAETDASVTPPCDDSSFDASDSSAEEFAPVVIASAITAYNHYKEWVGEDHSPEMVTIHLGDYGWEAAEWLGQADSFDGGDHCQVYIDSVDVNDSETQGTMAHEMFHCFQFSNDWLNLDYNWNRWAYEGTAMASEQDVFPSNNSEHDWLDDYFNNYIPLEDRSYDAVFPFFIFLQNGHQAGFYNFLETAAQDSNPMTALSQSFPDFENSWHEITKLTYNYDPLGPTVNDGGIIVEGSSWYFPTLGSISLLPNETTPVNDLPPLDTLSYYMLRLQQTMESTTPLTRLEIRDLPTDPEIRITLMMSDGDSNFSVVDLPAGTTSYVVCRRKVGKCHDTSDDQIFPFFDILVYFTNVSPEQTINIGPIELDTYNPNLDGNWQVTFIESNMPSEAWDDIFASTSGASVTIDEEQNPDYISEIGIETSVDVAYDSFTDTSATGEINLLGVISGSIPYNQIVSVSLLSTAFWDGAFVLQGDTLVITTQGGPFLELIGQMWIEMTLQKINDS